LAFDGSARQGVAGAGVVITSPTGGKIRYVFRILFEASNNAAEYEALIAGLKAAHSLGVRELRVRGDSQLVINQVNGVCGCHKAHLAAYLIEVKKLELGFEAIEYVFIPRDSNTEADELSVIASSRQPPPMGVFDRKIPVPSARPADPGAEGGHDVLPETLVTTSILPYAGDRTGTSGASGLATGEAHDPVRGSGDILPHAEDSTGTYRASGLAVGGTQRTSSAWIDEIRIYLSDNILPDDDAAAKRVTRQARRYTLVEGDLYQRGANGVYLRCITREKGSEILADIHEGECGSHASARNLVGKAIRHGFYWPTALTDAFDLVRRCKSCQFHSKQIHTPA
jgi:ribonuclease HI